MDDVRATPACEPCATFEGTKLTSATMSSVSFTRFDDYARRGLLVLASVVAVGAGLYRLRTFDTFFHLATGRLIRETGAVPTVDPFSFTFPGAPWRNHSWGYQVLLERLHALGGFAALSLLQALTTLALFALVVWYAGRRSPELRPWATVLSVLPMVAHREVLEARPHMIAFVFLAGALVLVELARKRPLLGLALVPLHAVWATTHASNTVVLLLAAVAGVEAAWQRRWRDAAVWLVVLACIAAVVTALAGFGLSGDHLASEFLGSSVKEWMPVSGHYLQDYWTGRAFVAIVVLSLAGLLIAHKEPDEAPAVPRGIAPTTLLLCFLALAYTSLRMLALFMLAAQPLWVPYAALVLRSLWRHVRWPHVELAVVGASLLGLASLLAPSTDFQLGAGLAHDRFPEEAVRSMRERGRIARVYNAYNFGGYLMWERIPVFVDGRAITVYPNSFLQAHDSAYANPAIFDALAQRYAVDGVILPVASVRVQQLRSYLATSARWQLAHHDDVAEVFELLR